MNVESFIKKIKETKSFQKFEETEMNEMSTTAGVPGYQTPNAFSRNKKDFEKHSEKSAEESGLEVVPNKSKKNFESVYKQAMDVLLEGTYKEFKTDETRSTNRKINDSIKNINRIMYEVERVVDHAGRLKTEMAVDERTLWRESRSRLVKIAERINRISKKLHELGA